jgi:hypothetical protein
MMGIDASLVTPALHVRNEAYWIHYVLRDVFKVFGRAHMIDTGSNDFTAEYAQSTADELGAELTLTIEYMGDDAEKIGRCSSRLREAIDTPWMLLVDGDEIWREAQLRRMLEVFDPIPDLEVGLVIGRNQAVVAGQLMERGDKGCYDRLFSPVVRWDYRTDYPFQSHGLEDRVERGCAHYFNGDEVWFWHMRHVPRSLHEQAAYFRNEKRAYYPYDGEYTPIPADWLGEISPKYPNPFLGVD